MKNVGYYNGRICPLEELMIPALDRAVYLGDSIYEYILVRNKKPFAFGDHLDRFFKCCSEMRFPLTFDRAQLTAISEETIGYADDDAEYHVLYLQSSRGTGMRSHSFPPDTVAPNLLIMVTPSSFVSVHEPMKVQTIEDKRTLFCHLKTTNLIPAVFAAQSAKENNCQESIFCRGNIVTDASHSGVGILKDGVLFTHPLNNLILHSTSRIHVLKCCADAGLPVDETPFTKDSLKSADEVLIWSTPYLCRRVSHINGEPVGGKAVELAAEAILQPYYDRMIKETNI